MALTSGADGNRWQLLEDAPGFLQSFDGGGVLQVRRPPTLEFLRASRGKAFVAFDEPGHGRLLDGIMVVERIAFLGVHDAAFFMVFPFCSRSREAKNLAQRRTPRPSCTLTVSVVTPRRSAISL